MEVLCQKQVSEVEISSRMFPDRLDWISSLFMVDRPVTLQLSDGESMYGVMIRVTGMDEIQGSDKRQFSFRCRVTDNSANGRNLRALGLPANFDFRGRVDFQKKNGVFRVH